MQSTGAELIFSDQIRVFHGSTVAPFKKLTHKAYALRNYPVMTACGKKITAEVEPDLVHLNSTCLVGAAKGARQVKPDVPIVAHVREPLLQNRWGRLLAKMNRKHVDWFIGIDQFGLDSIDLDEKESRGTVVYNFVDLNAYKPKPDEQVASAREEFGFSSNKIVFLFLARVVETNGPLPLIQMVDRLSEQINEDAQFAIAGFSKNPEGYEKATWQAAIASDRFRTIEFVEDVPSLINSADAIVAPFTTPHSARSVFEGAANAKPAIVSAMPNLTELIVESQTGFSFNWHDPSKFVNAVNQLCEKSTRKRMSQCALKHAARYFDQKTNCHRTMEVYTQLLER